MVHPRATGDTLTSMMKKFLLIFKLHQNEESVRNKSTAIDSSERPDTTHQQQQPQQLPAPSGLNVLDNNGGGNDPEDEPIPAVDAEWVISIEGKIQRTRQDNEARLWAEHSIYRIPQNLKYGKHEAYIPRMVSLGPYHHHKKHLRWMDRHKWRCLDCILQRTGKKIGHFLASVQEVEEKARACYEGIKDMTSQEFVEMMVVDGCFVIELLRGYTEGFSTLNYTTEDPIFSTRGSIHTIRRDMIMLENQIPLFILDRLLSLQCGKPKQTGLVAKLAFVFFEPLKLTDAPLVNFKELEELENIQGEFHCLDVFRESLLYQGTKEVETKGFSQRRHQLIHCVTDLRKARIKFRRRPEHKVCDIQFKRGILQIPPLVIHDGTRSLFLNLMAFEQRHVSCGNAITSYVVFMDNLINSPEDVGHLLDRGIIEHWLGSDTEVADLFSQLCKEVVFDIHDSYLSKLYENVNDYASRRWNGWIASLKHKYFSSPWSIISFFAAFILLVLTYAQIFYGVYGYYKPRS